MWQTRNIPVIAVTALVALFLVLFLYAGLAPAPSSSPAPIDRTLFMAAEEERIRAGLKDPDSVRFRYEFVTTNGARATPGGQINFKNATGGYEGFQRFISGQTAPLLEGAIGPGEMNKQWTKSCGRER